METSHWHLLRSGLVGAAIVVALPWDVVARNASPTFAKDIAPILQAKCQSCHRPGEMAPMSLRTYQEARPWARSIKNKVSRREMPPWFIDRTIGIQKIQERCLADRCARSTTIVSGSTPARARAIRPTCRPRRCLPTAKDGASARPTSSSLRRNRSRCTRSVPTGGIDLHRRKPADGRPLDQGGAAETRELEDRAPLLRRRRAAGGRGRREPAWSGRRINTPRSYCAPLKTSGSWPARATSATARPRSAAIFPGAPVWCSRTTRAS